MLISAANSMSSFLILDVTGDRWRIFSKYFFKFLQDRAIVIVLRIKKGLH